VWPTDSAPGLHAGVARGHHPHHEQRAGLVVGGQEPVGVGHQDAPAAVAVGRRHLLDGAPVGAGHLVRPLEQLHLDGLGHVLGRVATGWDRTGAAVEGHGAVPPPPPGRRRPPPRLRPGARPRTGRPCGRTRWCRPPPPGCRRPGPGRRSAPRSLPSSRRADDERLSSANTSANSPPLAKPALRTR
jgi:hypothetical protein